MRILSEADDSGYLVESDGDESVYAGRNGKAEVAHLSQLLLRMQKHLYCIMHGYSGNASSYPVTTRTACDKITSDDCDPRVFTSVVENCSYRLSKSVP